ncbi:MAG: hypothetical protein AAGF11_54390 [Myxococcota bacterium]
MHDHPLFISSSLGSRVAAGVLGLVLLGAGALCCMFVLVIYWRGDLGDGLGSAELTSMALFISMALVLLNATWSLLAFAFNGRRPLLMLHRASMLPFGVVLAILMTVLAVIELAQGELATALALASGISWFVLLVRGWARRDRWDRRSRRRAKHANRTDS